MPQQKTPEAGKIYTLIPQVTKAIGAIRKEQQNSHMRYRYRGIDDALNCVSPVLVEHGISVSVKTKDHVVECTEEKGKTKYHATLSLRVTFYADDGSSISTTASGEGLSHADDKATAKAMSGAMKYALYFGLMIPVEANELQDPDKDASQSSVYNQAKELIEQAADDQGKLEELRERVNKSANFNDEQRASLNFLIDNLTK